jgi:hypothetical protein
MKLRLLPNMILTTLVRKGQGHSKVHLKYYSQRLFSGAISRQRLAEYVLVQVPFPQSLYSCLTLQRRRDEEGNQTACATESKPDDRLQDGPKV